MATLERERTPTRPGRGTAMIDVNPKRLSDRDESSLPAAKRLPQPERPKEFP